MVGGEAHPLGHAPEIGAVPDWYVGNQTHKNGIYYFAHESRMGCYLRSSEWQGLGKGHLCALSCFNLTPWRDACGNRN